MENKYLYEYRKYADSQDVLGMKTDKLIAGIEARRRLTREYSFAIPDNNALAAIANLDRPIVEIGAGTGYWAALLQDYGVDIVPYDPNPTPVKDPSKTKNRYSFTKRFTPVKRGTHRMIKHHQDRVLFVCWPCYDRPWSGLLLAAYQGDTVIYIGEGRYGCTGNGVFHTLLEKQWRLEDTVQIPQWFGINDCLWIYRREGPKVARRIHVKA